MNRPCLDCGTPTRGTRCDGCRGRREYLRGTPSQRGYGSNHRKAREALKGGLPDYCGYGCGRLLQPDGVWVAAHVVDGDESAGWLASCQLCNQRARR